MPAWSWGTISGPMAHPDLTRVNDRARSLSKYGRLEASVDSPGLPGRECPYLAADFCVRHRWLGRTQSTRGRKSGTTSFFFLSSPSLANISYRDQPRRPRSWSAAVKSQAKYRNPPVIEVVSGFVFEPIHGLTIAHFGLFWERIVKEFPEAKHAVPIGLEEGTPGGEPYFVPRLWLVNSSQDALIQLQANRFYFNWREGPNKSAYSSYTKIYEQFMRYWKLYVRVLSDVKIQQPQLQRCELTYVNHIAQSAGWSSMMDVGNVVTPLSWTKGETDGFLPAPKNVNWTVTFDLPDGKGILTAKMQPARRSVRDKQELILTLELSAVGAPTDRSDAGLESWFDTAHEWIVKGFEDMTAKNVQHAVWGKE